MIGKLNVGKNVWFYRSIGLSIIAIIGFLSFSPPRTDYCSLITDHCHGTHPPAFSQIRLKSRYPQLAVFIVMLVGYIFAILAGLIGTPVEVIISASYSYGLPGGRS